mmetsp:Transcript_1917/g.4202  ORF Transcript_1917/g.4202 Transcript_1917/m.4202 type:complete len:234 (-) Transcript_1917:747-1448(-)
MVNSLLNFTHLNGLFANLALHLTVLVGRTVSPSLEIETKLFAAFLFVGSNRLEHGQVLGVPNNFVRATRSFRLAILAAILHHLRCFLEFKFATRFGEYTQLQLARRAYQSILDQTWLVEKYARIQRLIHPGSQSVRNRVIVKFSTLHGRQQVPSLIHTLGRIVNKETLLFFASHQMQRKIFLVIFILQDKMNCLETCAIPRQHAHSSMHKARFRMIVSIRRLGQGTEAFSQRK